MSGGSIIGLWVVLAGLAGLAVFALVTTIVSAAYHRKTGEMPTLLQNLLIVITVGILWWSGTAALQLDFVWVFIPMSILPIGIVSVYLARTTGVSRRAVVTTAIMAWGASFFLGVSTSYVAVTQLNSLLPSAVVGGLTIVLSMLLLSNRLVRELYTVTPVKNPAK